MLNKQSALIISFFPTDTAKLIEMPKSEAAGPLMKSAGISPGNGNSPTRLD